MNILLLCNRVPYPVNDGWTIAVYNMIKGLAKTGNKVTVLCFNTKKHYYPEAKLPQELLDSCELHTVYLDTDVKPIAAFFNLFSSQSYHITRFISKAFEQKLHELLQTNTFDVVQFEGLSVTPYVQFARTNSTAKMVYRAHNIEHVIWQRLYQTTTFLPKKLYLKLLTARLKSFEEKQLQYFDAIVPITNQDKSWLKQCQPHLPIHTIPAGLELDTFPAVQPPVNAYSIFHIGALDWQPNQEALKWFLTSVWPLLQKQLPHLQFFIAGKNTPEAYFNWNIAGVKVLGQVPNAAQFMQAHNVMVVPLLSGSGMRLKVIEGMALGKTIVSTTVGAEGVICNPSEDILLADTPADFSAAIAYCIANAEKSEKIGKKAAQTARKHYEYSALTNQLVAFYQQLL